MYSSWTTVSNYYYYYYYFITNSPVNAAISFPWMVLAALEIPGFHIAISPRPIVAAYGPQINAQVISIYNLFIFSFCCSRSICFFFFSPLLLHPCIPSDSRFLLTPGKFLLYKYIFIIYFHSYFFLYCATLGRNWLGWRIKKKCYIAL